MNVISKTRLTQFIEKHPEAAVSPMAWYKAIKKAEWSNFVDIKTTFNSADYVAPYVIFDVGGNKYRVTVEINYRIKFVFVRFVETHAEYAKRSRGPVQWQ